MTEATVSEAAPIVNGPSGFVLTEGRAYTRSELMVGMRASKHTFERWELAGLKPLTTGTKTEYFWGGDLLRVFRLEKLPDPYESPHAEKNRTRKKPSRGKE